jgi:hypothetical protein
MVTLSLTGCFEVHQGHYVASKVSGWHRWEDDGLYYFKYHTKKTPNCHIQFRGQRGRLNITIGSNGYYPYAIWKPGLLHFSDQPIKIKFVDRDQEIIIPNNSFKTLFGQSLEVGNSTNFIVTIPSFKIMDNTVPKLSTHVYWSKGKYLIWIPLQ